MKIKHLLLIFVAACICTAAQAQTTGEKIKAFADEHLRLSGYLQGGYRWDENADPSNTFYLHRARLSLTGDAAKDKIDYRLQVDMAGSPKICDLYFRYKPMKELNVELGQFKVPFSYENENCGPTTVEFIEYSYITTYLARNNGLYDGINGATGRDIGLQLYGGFFERDGYSILNYNVAVFNGSGVNVKDHNSSKDFVARLIVKPFKGFAVSGSYMYAETSFGGDRYMKSPRFALGAWYEDGTWIGRAEFVQANFGGDLLTSSLYALAGYNFEKPWSVYARYEFIRDNYDIIDENVALTNNRIQLGTAYKPFKFLRLQANVSYIFVPEVMVDELMQPFVPQQIAGTRAGTQSFGFNLLVTAMF